MIFKQCCISNTTYGNDNGDALKGYPLTDFVPLDLIRDIVYPSLLSILVGLSMKDAFFLWKCGILSAANSQGMEMHTSLRFEY